jgi:hypothetical protein
MPFFARRFVVLAVCTVTGCGSSSGAPDHAGAPGTRDAGTQDAEQTADGKGAGPDAGPDGGRLDSASGPTPEGGGGGADVEVSIPDGGMVFTIDLKKGPKRIFNPPEDPVAVSPYIYGVNAFAAWNQTTKWGLLRWGGDATTDLNWTNNFSNDGSDYCFWQGNEDNGSTALAGTLTTGTPSVVTDQTIGAASLVTVPIVDYVASSAVTNNVWSGSTPPCPGTPTCTSGTGNGLAMNVGGLAFASANSTSTAFVANHATKGTVFCTSTTGGGCAVDTTGPVYQDEFVNFMMVTYGSGAPIFFMLDNEPNYWASTHPEIWPYTGTLGCGTSGTISFDDIVTRNTTFATAIKNVWPKALVFGPVVAQDGIVYAGDYSDPNLATTTFAPYYLSKMAAASDAAGHPLIDSFDTHYYTSNSQDPSQCLQVPRMFWDPNFTDFSTSTTDSIDFGWSGQNNYFDTDLYPRQMIPRVQGWISTAYKDAKTAAPGYSISEYDVGCETAIEGGVAEADLLGVFGREGLFGATMWPLKTVSTTSPTTLMNYPVAAFDLYRNYDGKGAIVGDTAVYASTPDVADTSIYAFTSSTQSGEVDLVAINKTASPLPFVAAVANAPALSRASAYQLVSGAPIGVTVATGSAPAVACNGGGCSVSYTMPATSATTIILQ